MDEETPRSDRTDRRRRLRQLERVHLLVALVILAIAATVTIVLVATAPPSDIRTDRVTLSDALQLVDAGAVNAAAIHDATKTLTLTVADEHVDRAYKAAAATAARRDRSIDGPPGADTAIYNIEAGFPAMYGEKLTQALVDAGVPLDTRTVKPMHPAARVLTGLLPIVLILAGAYFLISRQGHGVAKMASGKTKQVEPPVTTFADIAGCDEAVEELADVVEFLTDPGRFAHSGARAPKGVLLEGPPGTGKTLLARATAGEASVPFFALAGSDFVETFVGVGARRVRDLFARARKAGTAVIFIDEIDAVGKKRNQGPTANGNDERENTLNALLVEMDGFQASNIIVIAATNRSDTLDSALLRPGRFDRRVVVPAPDRAGRTRILEVHARGKRLADDVDFVALARRTPGLTGADLANLLNQAALLAARDTSSGGVIDAGHLEQALQTSMLGRERRSAVVTDRDRLITAYHEAGHTIAALVQPDADDPVTVTIVPRGPAGGVTWMSGSDRMFLTRREAQAQLVVSMAGRAAEEILLDGDYTQGAGGDLLAATDLAVKMVTQYGMGPTLSVVTAERYAAGGTAGVDGAVEELLADALQAARRLLAEQRGGFDTLVRWLLEDETVGQQRLAALPVATPAAPANALTG